ncbi:iron permease [Hysterangium stoloniferum]|nr:iron permease [Hysterangium stoloniferum]
MQPDESESKPQRGWRFWIIFLSLCSSIFLSALDLSSIGTALPAIVHDLQGSDSFAWVSAAYTLTCTVILPLSGQLAEIFGRRRILLLALSLFAVGSLVCALSTSMAMLIGGRAIQGVGSGGIQALVAIVVADLVTLRERGLFIAATGAAQGIATAAGPFIAGVFAQRVSWRWYLSRIFYINLPLTAVAIAVVIFALRVKQPPRTNMAKKLMSIDWVGHFVIIASTASCILALTWAGIEFPWTSVQVLAPLICGLVGIGGALIYEALLAKNPTIPIIILSNRTSLSGYVLSSLIILMCNDPGWLTGNISPAYFQACKLATPLKSGLYFFPMAVIISPAAIIQGIWIKRTGNYRAVSVFGWSFLLIGVGLLFLLRANTSIGISIIPQSFGAFGIGLLYCTQFSILAPLDPELNAQAISFLLFIRSFSQTWGVAIGASLLQNYLKRHLPLEFVSTFPPNENLAYGAIQAIPGLERTLQDQVRSVYADAFLILWRVCLGLSGVGLLSVAAQKSIALHQKTDERWGLEESDEDMTNEKKDGENEMVDGEKALDNGLDSGELVRSDA